MTTPPTLQFPERVGIGAFAGGDPMDPPANDAVIYNGIKSVGFKSYHSWHPQKLMGDDGSLLFYPAFFYPVDITSANLALAKATNQLIINLNEPWHTDPGWVYTSPTQMLDLWPQFISLGNRLATPSGSDPSFAQGSQWLDDFMNGATSRGYRVDVINIHYYHNGHIYGYGADAVQMFHDALVTVHNRYGQRPVIVTEWALGTWDDPGYSLAGRQSGQFSPPPFTWQQQIDWSNACIAMMDSLSFVEKHFWFAATEGGGFYLDSGVLNSDGTPTPVGLNFAAMLGGTADISPPPPPPPPPPDQPAGPNMSSLMNARSLLRNPDQGTSIPDGAVNTYSHFLNARNVNRKT